MNTELKKIVARVKTAQSKLQTMMKKQDWMEEARKYAEKQGTEVRKLLSSDLGKVRTFIEREKKELARFQKQIPGEVKRFRSLLAQQRKDLEKMLSSIGSIAGREKTGAKKKTSLKAKAGGTRKKSSRGESASAST